MIGIKSSGFLIAVCLIAILVLFAAPVITNAADFMVCDDAGGGDPCDFEDLIELAITVINYLVLISIPLASISFVFAGVTYITAQGSQSKIDKAHGIFKKTLIGFVFILAAWVIVYTIGKALIDPNSVFFQIFNNSRP
jgi:hypothetical protein